MADAQGSGRVPPHDLEAEAALLGAILLDGDVLHLISDKVGPDHFYDGRHRMVFEAILGLESVGGAVDVITVKDELRRRKTFDAAGGGEILVRLMESVPSSAAARHHARIVKDMARLRGLLAASHEIARLCYEHTGAVPELVDHCEQMVFRVRGEDTADVSSISDLIREEVTEIEKRAQLGGKVVPGLATGFVDLDAKLGGLRNGELLIVAARPSMGKTTFALNIATNAAVRAEVPTLIFSLEVARMQVAENLLCSLARFDAQRVRTGTVTADDWPPLLDAANSLSGAPIYIDDTPAISLLGLRAKARRMKARIGNLGLIMVDYLQLMTCPGAESRQHEISQISQGLKALARELEVPVMALSQLNRAVDARDDHRPRMSDLRESGSIEQDADVIMFLYRDAYYKADQDLLPQQRVSAEVIVGKHRNGPTGVVQLYFFGERLRFEDPVRS